MKTSGSRHRHRGFTLFEMTIAGFLIALVANLLANAWVGFGRPAISAVARARLAQEANLFSEALARDVGRLACLGQPRTNSRYQNVQAAADGKTLYLTIDEGKEELRAFSYSIDENDPGKLCRRDLASGDKRVVTTLVSAFDCTHDTFPVGPSNEPVVGVQIDLTLRHRVNERDRDGTFRADHTRRYRLFIPDP